MTSLASQFSKQLQDLIAKIRSTRSHFIRCIKPNNQLLANCFDYEMVMNQLRCGGALGAVQVFRAGFPNRMDFKFFVNRYSAFLVVCGVNILTKDLYECMVRARKTGSDELWRISSSMLIDIVSLTVIVLNIIDEGSEVADKVDILSGLQMGKTQVFLRAPVFEYLERLHARSITVIAKRLQRRRRAVTIARDHKFRTAAPVAATSLMYYAYRRRVLARQCVSATILLQRRVRVFLEVVRRKKAIRGFSKLKAWYRGGKAREYVRTVKRKSAVTIQSKYRSYAAKSKYKALKKSTTYCQSIIRGWIARCSKKKKLKLILLLQCLWRGTMARVKTFLYRQKLVSIYVLFFCFLFSS
jgi:myosin-5